MGIKNMKQLIGFVMLCFFLSSCYSFDNNPFPESLMRPTAENKLVQDAINYAEKLPYNNETKDLIEGLKEFKKVYEIAPDFLVAYEDTEGKNNLTIINRNDHHIFVCIPTTILDPSKVDVDGVKIVSDNNNPNFPSYKVNGDAESLKEWAEKFAIHSAKLCAAFPHE